MGLVVCIFFGLTKIAEDFGEFSYPSDCVEVLSESVSKRESQRRNKKNRPLSAAEAENRTIRHINTFTCVHLLLGPICAELVTFE